LSKEETDAANKLFKILKTTEGRTGNQSIKFTCKENLERQKTDGHYHENSERYPKSGFHNLHSKKKTLPRLD
jgi:hypothetical protein